MSWGLAGKDGARWEDSYAASRVASRSEVGLPAGRSAMPEVLVSRLD
jgi:hypothetical protein